MAKSLTVLEEFINMLSILYLFEALFEPKFKTVVLCMLRRKKINTSLKIRYTSILYKYLAYDKIDN